MRGTIRGVPRQSRGLTLIEVLISMFVLLIGLLGVAAMIPAGKFEIQQGVKVDRATTVGRAAFRDLKVRGFLDVTQWADLPGNRIWDPTSIAQPFAFSFPVPITTDRPAVAIDPLGLLAPSAPGFGPTFPATAVTAQPLLYRIHPSVQLANLPDLGQQAALADLWFRNSDDLVFTPNSIDDDRPPTQTLLAELGGAGGNVVARPAEKLLDPVTDPPVKRMSEGNYSWLATIVTDPTTSARRSRVTVSVVVFFKRDLTQPAKSERIADVVAMPGQGLGGGEFVIDAPTAPNEPVKPGQWVMLAGRIPAGGANNDYYRWYRVIAADTPNGGLQRITLAGPDWNVLDKNNVKVWVFENIVAVYEKNMRLEVP